MSEIIFAFKCILAVFFVVLFAFFTTYFVLANDHVVTIYINPIYFNKISYGATSEFVLPVWRLALIAFAIGGIIMYVVCQVKFYKQKNNIDSLCKENETLKGKFDKVKTDISKCVT